MRKWVMGKVTKPESWEENYNNIKYLEETFRNKIDSFIQHYNNIKCKYGDPYRYNSLLQLGYIDPNQSFYTEMEGLAFEISWFTILTFERVAYALDYWLICTTTTRKDGRTTKNYDRALELLAEKRKITGSEKEILKSFRGKRNCAIHSARIEFCDFIFVNRNVLYKLIYVLRKLLEEKKLVQLFIPVSEGDNKLIESMERTFGEISSNRNNNID